jgi:hypothetical protein
LRKKYRSTVAYFCLKASIALVLLEFTRTARSPKNSWLPATEILSVLGLLPALFSIESHLGVRIWKESPSRRKIVVIDDRVTFDSSEATSDMSGIDDGSNLLTSYSYSAFKRKLIY